MHIIKLYNTDAFRFQNFFVSKFTSINNCIVICNEKKCSGFVVYNKTVYYRKHTFEELITNYIYYENSILYLIVPTLYKKNLLTNKERIEYYTVGIKNTFYDLKKNDHYDKYKYNTIDSLEIKIESYKKINKCRKNWKKRWTERHHRFLYEYLKMLNINTKAGFLIYPFDRFTGIPIPCFVKSRSIVSPKCSILLPLEEIYLPHKIFNCIQDDIPFNNKKNNIIWRGTNTLGWGNRVHRIDLVKKFHNHAHFNIGFSDMRYNHDKFNKKYIKGRISIKEQLTYKFILSVEGHDFATNLSWIMLSNSIPICPKHMVETWSMESKLIPYDHYIPVKNDFSDLEEVYETALNNKKMCDKILFQKKLFYSQFLNPVREDNLIKDVIKQYFLKQKTKYI